MQYIPADNTAAMLLIEALGNLGSGLGARSGYNEALKRKEQEGKSFNSLLSSLGYQFPQGINPTDPMSQNLMAQMALQNQVGKQRMSEIGAKPNPEGQGEFVARLGQLIAEGKATPSQIKIFNQLTEKAGTTVTVNNAGETVAALPNQLDALQKGERLIQEFTNNPENKDLLKNKSVGIETDTNGNPILNIEPKDKPSSEDIKGKEFLELLKSKVQEINELSSDSKLYGPIQGRMGAVQAATTGGNPKFVKMRQLLDSLILRVYMLSGKQINETELKFLQGIQPQHSDPDSTFKTKLSGFYNELQTMSEIKTDLWNQLGVKIPTSEKTKDTTDIQKRANKYLD